MLNKKIITLTGATVVTVSLLAGVTYAWFTNTKVATAGQITAGKLGIEFQVNEDKTGSTPALLYPQLTIVEEDGTEYPDPNGTIADVATTTFTLTNVSDRQVLVKVSGSGLLEGGVMGSAVDADGNVDEPNSPVALNDTSAVKILYDFGAANLVYRKGNDAYILLPTAIAETEVTVKVWIDGATGGNEYQNATIDFAEMTAIAVQYREAAIRATFTELVDADIAAILTATGVAFE